MTQSCFGLRCCGFSTAESYLLERVGEYFESERRFVVLDERSQQQSVPNDVRKVSLNAQAIDDRGLFDHPDLGWLCGDYFYYLLELAHPDFDYYWLCEPDVYFSLNNVQAFFEKYENVDADFLAPGFERKGADWSWTSRARIISENVFGCLFPLTRLSRRAIRHLLSIRSHLISLLEDKTQWKRLWPNDEGFVATTLMRDGFICNSLETFEEPDFFSHFSFDKAIPLSARAGFPMNKILHPVLEHDEFLRKCQKVAGFKINRSDLMPWVAGLSDYCEDGLRRELRVSLMTTLEEFLTKAMRRRRPLIRSGEGRVPERLNHGQPTGAENRKLKRFPIIDKRKRPFAMSLCEDLTLGGGREIARFNKQIYTPYQFSYKDSLFFLVDTPVCVSDEPFFYQGQFNSATHVITVHLSVMRTLYGPARTDLRPTVVFSMGRCGSTLFTRLAAAAGCYSFSEPDVFAGATRHRTNPKVEEVCRLALLSLMHYARVEDQKLVIKLRSSCNVITDRITAAFPQARYVVIVRDVRDWAMSYITKFDWSCEMLGRTLLNMVNCVGFLSDNDIPFTLLDFDDFRAHPKRVFDLVTDGELAFEAVREKLSVAAAVDSQKGAVFALNSEVANVPERVDDFLTFWERTKPVEELRRLGLCL